jgi:membrane protein YdbS with pleckstrin-like domain
MLTQQEKDFIDYWERNRDRQKRVFWQFLLGIPAGLLLAVPIALNFFSGWNKMAAMLVNSGGLTLLVALVLIVVFVAIFSQRYKWDQREQKYLELIARRSEETPEN